MYKVFEYNVFKVALNSSQNCYFALQTIDNAKDCVIELMTNEETEEIELNIYIQPDNFDKFIENNPAFHNLDHYIYDDVDSEFIKIHEEIRMTTINDIKELWGLYKQYEQLYQRYIP